MGLGFWGGYGVVRKWGVDKYKRDEDEDESQAREEKI